MTTGRKKKSAARKSAGESISNAGTDREDGNPKVPNDGERVEDLVVEMGPDGVNEGADQLTEIQNLEKALVQIEELKEQRLRARAETDNIRKRAEAEISNVRKFALEGFARELLSVKDSLELARAVDLEIESSDNIIAKVVEGLDLTIKQLETTFGRFSIEEISPELGDKFDPEQHQAMSIKETTEFESNQICEVIQKGYLLHSRLLRPAMVIVAKEPN
jgi:molecular chaperone GrpE